MARRSTRFVARALTPSPLSNGRRRLRFAGLRGMVSPMPGARPVLPKFDAPRALRRRRISRAIVITGCTLFALFILLDHLGAFGWHGDDWSRFDRQTFTVSRILDGGALTLRDPGGRETAVSLIGVAAPVGSEYWAAESARYLADHAAGKSVIVRLEPTQTRDAAKRLWAYLYLTDADLLNADIIHDGHAYADRRVKHSLGPMLILVESDARKHHRGLWGQVKDDQQPAWRQQWLKELHK